MTGTDTDEAKQEFLALLKTFEGIEYGTQVGPDAVNQAMIRHWVDAMGDENPVYVDEEAAKRSVHGRIIAPAVMLQAWCMTGIKGRRAGGNPKQEELMGLFDSAGFTSVVATNCEQEYDRMVHIGDHLRTRTVVESISEEKQTGLGVGHFLTTRVEYETLEGEPVGRQMFRILKFKPGTGRSAATPAPAESVSSPGDGSPADRRLRPRPAITPDSRFWFDAAKEHRLLIQRCAGCRTLRHPPRPRCDRCGSYEWDTVESSGRGTVYSFVVNHHPQIPAFDYPLPIALVELEEGTRLVADLVGVEVSDIEVGMEVEVEWQDHDPDLSLPAFRPVSRGA